MLDNSDDHSVFPEKQSSQTPQQFNDPTQSVAHDQLPASTVHNNDHNSLISEQIQHPFDPLEEVTAIGDEEEGEEEEVRREPIEITPEMVNKIDQEQWPHVNGTTDPTGQWKEWHETSLTVNDYDGEPFVILPYVNIS